jgi:hypothetical protein
LAGEISRLREVSKIPDCRDGSLIHKVLHGGEPSLGANMDNDLVSLSQQRFSRSMSKPVSGAGDKIRAFWLVFEGDGAEVRSFRGFNRACAMDVAVAIRDPATTPKPTPTPGTRNLRRSMDEPCFSSEFWFGS